MALAALATLVLAITPGPATAQDRPRITSFYAKDEGGIIQLRVAWCVSGDQLGDSIISTFRMWDASTDRLMVIRRVSGRARVRCNTDSLRLRDIYPSGVYLANAAVTNRTRGGFIRIRARQFTIF